MAKRSSSNTGTGSTIDLVYVLGSGSKWNNNEIRYSLRSVEKHVRNVGDIVILCSDRRQRPGFLGGVNYPTVRGSSAGSQADQTSKILHYCKQIPPRPFILMNDDFFFCADIDARSIPLMVSQEVPTVHDLVRLCANRNDRAKYTRVCERTQTECDRLGLPGDNYELHVPIPIDPRVYVIAVTAAEWAKGTSFNSRSLYGNAMPDRIPRQRIDDVKMYSWSGPPNLEKMKFFSICNEFLDGPGAAGKQFLASLYPNPSRWEVDT